MKELWNAMQFAFTVLGGWIGYFLGGCDGLIIALTCFVAVDYITGLMCAVSDKKLSSRAGFKGICRKVLIFTLVGVANIIDIQVIHTGSVLRTAVIFFLSLKRGCIISGKRSTSWTSHSEKAERSSGTAARQTQ